MSAIPLHEVFKSRAEGVGHLLRNYLTDMRGWASNEDLSPYLSTRGGNPCIEFHRRSMQGRGTDVMIVFANITPKGVDNVKFGREQITNNEEIGQYEQDFDNRLSDEAIEVDLGETFGESQEQEDSKSAGASVSVEISSSQSIEGVASFDESITAEAHTEIEQSQSKGSEHSRETAEKTSIPPGKLVKITQIRSRADGVILVSADGEFDHNLRVGSYDHKDHPHHWHSDTQAWDTWEDFCDAVLGDAPDNISMARTFKDKPPYHADLWALGELNAEVRYTMKFEGRIMFSYKVVTEGNEYHSKSHGKGHNPNAVIGSLLKKHGLV